MGDTKPIPYTVWREIFAGVYFCGLETNFCYYYKFVFLDEN